MHGARSVYSTLLLLIRSYGSTAQDNVKLTCERGGPRRILNAVRFIVVTGRRERRNLRAYVSLTHRHQYSNRGSSVRTREINGQNEHIARKMRSLALSLN